MKQATKTVSAMIVLFILGACGSATTQADGPEVGAEGRATTLMVENQSTSDMRVYVEASGMQVRLGSVTSLSTRRLEIPSSIVGNGRDLRFVVDPLAGSSTASSYSIFVEPGEEVTLTVPPRVR